MDVRVLPGDRDGELSGELLPLTGSQASVWFHQQLDPGSVAYNVGQYIEIDGVIDPERMAAGFHPFQTVTSDGLVTV